MVVSSKPSKVEGNYPIILPPVKGSKCSRGSAFPHPGAGLDAAQEEHRKTNKVVDPPETKEGDCPGVGIADCSWEQPLGTVPAPSWGTELLCTAVGVVGGLCPCPGHTLAVHGHRCLTPGLRRAAIPDRRCHLNPDQWEICRVSTQPRGPSLPGCALSPSRTSQDAGTAPQELALGEFCTESGAQAQELLARTSSEQSGGRLWHSLGSSHPLSTPAVSQPARPLMLLTLLVDYLGVMSFAPLSWPCARGCGMCNTSCTGPRGGQLLPGTQAHNAAMFPDKIPARAGG